MRPETFPSRSTPKPPVAGPLANTLDRSGPITLLARTLDPVIARAIDEVPSEILPEMRADGDLEAIDAALRQGLADLRRWQPWLEAWLRDDVSFLARLFTELTDAPVLALRMEVIDDDACRRFHTDRVTHRLVTTYRGDGTQWVSPRDSHLVVDGRLEDDSACRRLERGAVGILRGSRNASPDAPAVLHRSPPVRGTDAVRLFLAIDDMRDWQAPQSLRAPGSAGRAQ
ncbi:DUF1826 domain-containing protein [Amorphus coralli]|uniref:DUF1826 domain-containing protein n=1 Tax=Amorphus coralli TaxID=340680 RepID=UPI000A051850|nr:DUF1826 domain-containing protein [Amorphus coralli]